MNKRAEFNGMEFHGLSKRRGVTQTDVMAIGRLMAEKRMLPGEACAVIGLNYRTWARWTQKEANNVRFAALIERLRGERLSILIDRIDDASKGVNMKQPDWRAAAWLAGKVAPERFEDARNVPNGPITVNNITNVLMAEAKERIYGAASVAASVAAKTLETLEPKQIKGMDTTS